MEPSQQLYPPNAARIQLGQIKSIPRRPLSTDVKDPITGAYYSVPTFWTVTNKPDGTGPTTGVQGELWILTRIVAGAASWVYLLNSTTGPIYTIDVDTGADVVPTALGVVSIKGQTTPSTNGVETFNVSASEAGIRLLSPFVGDYSFDSSTAGATRTLRAQNTDNTSGTSNARVVAATGGASGGDPSFTTIIGTARSFAHGVDNSDSDTYKLVTAPDASATPSSGNTLVATDVSGNQTVTGSITSISGNITASSGNVIATSTDAGAALGPTIEAYRNSASAATNDLIGEISLTGNDAAGTKVTYGKMYARITDATAGAADGQLVWQTLVNSVLTTYMTLDGTGGLAISLPTSITTTTQTPLTVQQNDDGAGSGPNINFLRNSASPAASDQLSQYTFQGRDATPATVTYSLFYTEIVAATAGAHSGRFTIQTANAGSLVSQVVVQNTGTQVRGNNTNTAPPAGYLGEQLTASATAVALTTTVAANITSVVLTAGIWNVDGMVSFITGTSGGIDTFTATASVSTTSATHDSTTQMLTAIGSITAAISMRFPCTTTQNRITVAAGATTTVYLVGTATSGLSLTADGRIKATRVG